MTRTGWWAAFTVAAVGLVSVVPLAASPYGGPGRVSRSGAAWATGTRVGTQHTRGALTLERGRRQGTWTAPLPVGVKFDRLLVSLNPDGALPKGSRVVSQVRLRVGGRWTGWLAVGTYGGDAGLPRSSVVKPSLGVKVETDLVVCSRPASAAELRLELSAQLTSGSRPPRIARVVVDRWRRAATPPARGSRSLAWGRVVEGVPARSQAVEDPSIASRVCSPTSLGMVLGRWGRRASTAAVASAVYDHGAKIYGNWSFNVAHAGALGLDARAVHLRGWSEIEAEILAGRPVVVSHRFAPGELRNAPIGSTQGHLIVIVGFTRDGDVVVHDPAANPRQREAVRRVYRRDDLAKTVWVNAEGVGYLIRPPSR